MDYDEFSQSDSVLCGSSRRAKERKSRSKSKHGEDAKAKATKVQANLRASYPLPPESYKAKDSMRGLRKSHMQPIDNRSKSSRRDEHEKEMRKGGKVKNAGKDEKIKAKASASARPLPKLSEEHVFEKSLDTFASCPSTESDVYEPMDSLGEVAEEGAASSLQDHNESMYTFPDTFVKNGTHDEQSEVGDDTHSQTDGSVQDHGISMYTFWGDEHKCLEEEEDCSRVTDDDDQDDPLPPTATYQQQQQQQAEHIITYYQPILKRRPTPEDQKTKLNVSFALTEESNKGGEGPSSSKSSLTTTSSPSSAAYDADADENNGGQKGEKLFGDLGRVNEILGRSSSFPVSTRDQNGGEVPKVDQQAPPKRRPSSFHRVEPNRVSWTAGGIDEIKEEIRVRRASLDDDGRTRSGSGISKKNLKELDMGKTIPKQLGRVRQRSFHSALKSIHKRSSVMMPPSTNAAVNLN